MDQISLDLSPSPLLCLSTEAARASAASEASIPVVYRAPLRTASIHLGRAATLLPGVAAAYVDRLLAGIRRQVAWEDARLAGENGRFCGPDLERFAGAKAALALYERARAGLPAAAVLHVEVPRTDGAIDETGSRWAELRRRVHNPCGRGCAGVVIWVRRQETADRRKTWVTNASICFPCAFHSGLAEATSYATPDEALVAADAWAGLGLALLSPEAVADRAWRRRERRTARMTQNGRARGAL